MGAGKGGVGLQNALNLRSLFKKLGVVVALTQDEAGLRVRVAVSEHPGEGLLPRFDLASSRIGDA
jgi:hypothetical protein